VDDTDAVAHDSPWAYDSRHRRPEGASDATVAAVGKASEALEWLERARGRLYDFHQMLGHLDFMMGDAARMLREAGHTDLADLVDREIVGRNVLDGRWTFQIIEEFEDTYYDQVRAVEQRLRDDLLGGRRHVYEAEMKERRRTAGWPAHEARPAAAHSPDVVTPPDG
jgi:hypothetical protein